MYRLGAWSVLVKYPNGSTESTVPMRSLEEALRYIESETGAGVILKVLSRS
jgi:hypothetical protein